MTHIDDVVAGLSQIYDELDELYEAEKDPKFQKAYDKAIWHINEALQWLEGHS